ncbi:MAG: CmcI family methyltransferase [bacterium]
MDKEEYLAQLSRAVDNFHQIYYNVTFDGKPVWNMTHWMGYLVHKCPFDLWIYQELFFGIKPDVIVESGVARGGGIAYYASLCAMMGKGEIIGIDIDLTDEARRAAAQFPSITLIEGSSTDPDVVDKVRRIVNGRNTIVILDSDHKMEHVLKEMQLYKEFVPLGGFMIVEDSNINGHPIYEGYGPGPYEAIEAFLKMNDDFAIDKYCEKFMMTFNPNGYLRRISE